jgi:hypothetical protein
MGASRANSSVRWRLYRARRGQERRRLSLPPRSIACPEMACDTPATTRLRSPHRRARAALSPQKAGSSPMWGLKTEQARGIGHAHPERPPGSGSQGEPGKANGPRSRSGILQAQQQPRTGSQRHRGPNRKQRHDASTLKRIGRQRSNQQRRVEQSARHQCPRYAQNERRLGTQSVQNRPRFSPHALPKVFDPSGLARLPYQNQSKQKDRSMKHAPQRPDRNGVRPKQSKPLDRASGKCTKQRIAQHAAELKCPQGPCAMGPCSSADPRAGSATHGHTVWATNQSHEQGRDGHGALHLHTLPRPLSAPGHQADPSQMIFENRARSRSTCKFLSKTMAMALTRNQPVGVTSTLLSVMLTRPCALISSMTSSSRAK